MQQSFPRFTAEFCRHSWSNFPQNLWFCLSLKIWESFFSTNYCYRSWSGTLISFFPDPGSNQKSFGINILPFLVNWLKFSVPAQNIEKFSNIVIFISTKKVRQLKFSPTLFCFCWFRDPRSGMEKNPNPGKKSRTLNTGKNNEGFMWTKKTKIRKARNCTSSHNLHWSYQYIKPGIESN